MLTTSHHMIQDRSFNFGPQDATLMTTGRNIQQSISTSEVKIPTRLQTINQMSRNQINSVQTAPGPQRHYETKCLDNFLQTSNEYGQKLSWLWHNNKVDGNDVIKSIESSQAAL